MSDQIVTARILAARLSAALGRTITDKAVRNWARANLAQYDKVTHPAYQGHAYSESDIDAITAAFTARTVNATVQLQAKNAATLDTAALDALIAARVAAALGQSPETAADSPAAPEGDAAESDDDAASA